MREMNLSQMSDQMVMAGFKSFSRDARMSDVKSLMYLGEVAARKLYVEAGYAGIRRRKACWHTQPPRSPRH